MALAGGGGGGAATASVGAPSVGGWGPGGGGSTSYHSMPSGGLPQPHLRQQQQQQQQQAELDRRASSVFPSAADPQQLLRCDTLASGMVPLRASNLSCGEVAVDASAVAAEHQRSVENLLKLQALQEAEGRWQDRERRWQAELGEERTRNADLTLRLQAAAEWRAKLEERVREDSQRILSCDRSEQRALDACQLAAQAAAAQAEADKAAADDLRREKAALEAEAAALRSEAERLRTDGDALRAESRELRKRPERVEPPPPPQAQPQPQLGLSEKERERLGALVRELRGELSAVEARRRSDKQGFQSGVAALQAELSALRALSAEHAREAEQTRDVARRLREKEGAAAALRVRLEQAEAARDAALRDKRGLQASAAAAAAAATAAVAAASAKGEEDSAAAAAAAAGPFAFGDGAARVRELEEQVAVLKKAKRAVAQEREGWKYRALLAAPASVNCMHCGRLVTVWPGEPPAAEQGLGSVPVSTGQQGKRTPPPPEGAAGCCSLYDSNECPHRCPRHPNAFA